MSAQAEMSCQTLSKALDAEKQHAAKSAALIDQLRHGLEAAAQEAQRQQAIIQQHPQQLEARISPRKMRTLEKKIAKAADAQASLQLKLSQVQTALQAAEASRDNANVQLKAAGQQIEVLQHDKQTLVARVAEHQQEADEQHQLLDEVHDHLQQQHASYKHLKAKHATVQKQAETAAAHVKHLEGQVSNLQQLHSGPSLVAEQLHQVSKRHEAALLELEEARSELAARKKQRQQATQRERDYQHHTERLQSELQMLLDEKLELQQSVNAAEASIQGAHDWQNQLLQEVGRLHAASQELANDKHAWAAAITELEARGNSMQAKTAEVQDC